MPSDIKERVVARNVKTLDRAALLQKAARPAALRVGETAKAANPAHTRERRGDEAEGGWAAARGESERTPPEGFGVEPAHRHGDLGPRVGVERVEQVRVAQEHGLLILL